VPRNRGPRRKGRARKLKREHKSPVVLDLDEMTAPLYADHDLAADTPRIEAAKMPEEVLQVVEHRLLKKIERVSTPELRAELQHVLQQRPVMQTLSETVVDRVQSALTNCVGKIAPEDTTTIMRWCMGDGETYNGYVTTVLMQIPDTQTQTALQGLDQTFMHIATRLEQADKKLFEEMVGELNPGNQRLIQGQLLVAKWEQSEGGLYAAKTSRATARRLTRYLVSCARRNDRYFPEDHPEDMWSS